MLLLGGVHHDNSSLLANFKRGCSCLHSCQGTYSSCSWFQSRATDKESPSYLPLAMALKIKTFFLVLLLLLIPLTSGFVEGFRDNMHPTHHALYKDGGIKMKSRKLFAHDFVLDYDEAGANPKHSRKPGKGP